MRKKKRKPKEIFVNIASCITCKYEQEAEGPAHAQLLARFHRFEKEHNRCYAVGRFVKA
jgi:hypothetical protein